MLADIDSRIWNTRTYQNRIDFSFALVVEEVANLRNSIVARLRERGWLVHGTNCAEEALRLLAHIPHSLIVVDSELPGMGGIDFGRVLQIRVVVISSSSSPSLQGQVGECAASGKRYIVSNVINMAKCAGAGANSDCVL